MVKVSNVFTTDVFTPNLILINLRFRVGSSLALSGYGRKRDRDKGRPSHNLKYSTWFVSVSRHCRRLSDYTDITPRSGRSFGASRGAVISLFLHRRQLLALSWPAACLLILIVNSMVVVVTVGAHAPQRRRRRRAPRPRRVALGSGPSPRPTEGGRHRAVALGPWRGGIRPSRFDCRVVQRTVCAV